MTKANKVVAERELSVEDAKRIVQAGWYLIELKNMQKYGKGFNFDYELTVRGPFSHKIARNWKRLFLLLNKGVKRG